MTNNIGNLTGHEYKHIEKSAHQCHLCSYSAKARLSLDTHLLRDHKNHGGVDLDPLADGNQVEVKMHPIESLQGEENVSQYIADNNVAEEDYWDAAATPATISMNSRSIEIRNQQPLKQLKDVFLFHFCSGHSIDPKENSVAETERLSPTDMEVDENHSLSLVYEEVSIPH